MDCKPLAAHLYCTVFVEWESKFLDLLHLAFEAPERIPVVPGRVGLAYLALVEALKEVESVEMLAVVAMVPVASRYLRGSWRRLGGGQNLEEVPQGALALEPSVMG